MGVKHRWSPLFPRVEMNKLLHLLQVMKFQQKQQPGPEHRGGCQRTKKTSQTDGVSPPEWRSCGLWGWDWEAWKKDWSKITIWQQSYVGKMSNLKDCTNCASFLFVACEVLTSYHMRAWDENRSLTCHIPLLKHNRRGIHLDVCPQLEKFVTASQAEELWHTSCCWHGTRGAGKTPVPGTGTSTSCVVRCSLRGPAVCRLAACYSCYGTSHLNPKNNFQSIEHHHAALVDLRDARMLQIHICQDGDSFVMEDSCS